MKFINLQTLVYLCNLETSKENKVDLLKTLNMILTVEWNLKIVVKIVGKKLCNYVKL